MFNILILGSVLISINVILQALSNIFWLKIVRTPLSSSYLSFSKSLKLLIGSFLFFTFLHAMQTFLWTVGYFSQSEIRIEFKDFTECLYFSMVTFTTLGYGDITLQSHGRILSGLEAINGIMLIGWTSAIMFSLIQNIFQKQGKNQFHK